MTSALKKKLEKILKAELGETPFGEARFRWLFSENILHPKIVRTIDPEDPSKMKPVFNYRCQCGLNRSVHSANCSTFVVAEPKVIMRKLIEGLDHQWVMCKWHPPDFSEADWDRLFGSIAAVYPRNGTYRPISYIGPVGPGTARKFIALDPGVVLSDSRMIDLTRDFCAKMLAERQRTEREWESLERDLAEKKEKARDTLLANKISDLLYPKWDTVPGKRGYGAVVPDPALQGAGDAAPMLITP